MQDGSGCRAILPLVVLAVLSASELWAQEAAEVAAAAAARSPSNALTIDYAVPPSPAFTFLGISPTEVTRPGTLRQLAVALLNVIDTAGTVRQGVAIDVIPYQLIRGRRLTIQRYRESLLIRLLANTQVSFATVRSAGDSSATDIGIGLRTAFIDRSDMRRSTALNDLIAKTLVGALAECPVSAIRSDSTCARKWRAANIEAANRSIDSLRTAFRDSNWNALRVEIGLGTGWTALQSRSNDTRRLGVGLWTAAAFPLGRRVQLLGSGQWRRRETPEPHDLFSGGAKLFVGSATFNLFVEGVYLHQDSVAGATDEAFYRLSFGTELRLAADVWIEVGFGSSVGIAGAPERLFSLANIKWGLGDRPKLEP